ncbi:MAG: hypothetical protein AAGH76_01585 [Pseudomonadota bacterium]
MRSAAFGLLAVLAPVMASAQGQDSLPSQRHLMVITENLAGHFVNANQAYFDGRRGLAAEDRHAFVEWRIEHTDSPGQLTLAIGDELGGSIALNADLETDRLLMTIALDSGARCDYAWRRDAAQFAAESLAPCPRPLPNQLRLAPEQLWLYPSPESAVSADAAFQLNRARAFTCHIDMPGVGGGRDIPYTRYDKLELHDLGGQAWITTDEEPSRRLGLSMLRVDWPINNYTDTYARDALVVYLSEETAEGRREIAYSFTEPTAERLGLNLKWLLAFCYRVPSSEATPEF